MLFDLPNDYDVLGSALRMRPLPVLEATLDLCVLQRACRCEVTSHCWQVTDANDNIFLFPADGCERSLPLTLSAIYAVAGDILMLMPAQSESFYWCSSGVARSVSAVLGRCPGWVVIQPQRE